MTKVTLANVGSLIDATTAETNINNNSAAIVTAVENTLSRDGTAPNTMSAPLDMNSKPILNLPAPVSGNSPLRLTDASILNGGGTIAILPTGGTTGQALKKASNANFDFTYGNDISSVDVTFPVGITVTGGPITSSGTIAGSWTGGTTGTGANVFATSPTMTTPVLGTPTSGNLVNCTGYQTVQLAGAGAGVATFLNTPSSANLRAALTDETGTGAAYFQGGDIGTPSAGVATNITALNATQLTTGTTPAARYSSSTTIRSNLGVGGKPLGFRATKGGTDQTTIADSTFTAVTFGTEDFDQGSFFASNTWTPVSGLVSIQASIASNAANQVVGSLSIASVFKNGARFKDFFAGPIALGSPYSLEVSMVDTANGTDAYTIQVFLDTNGGNGTVLGATNASWFSGIVYPD